MAGSCASARNPAPGVAIAAAAPAIARRRVNWEKLLLMLTSHWGSSTENHRNMANRFVQELSLQF